VRQWDDHIMGFCVLGVERKLFNFTERERDRKRERERERDRQTESYKGQ